MTTTTTYAVWYCAAGCLPDADEPEYVGTLRQCEHYATTAAYVDYMGACLDIGRTPVDFAEWDATGRPHGPGYENSTYGYEIDVHVDRLLADAW